MNKTIDEYYIGLMSGTSLDGIDAVLVRTNECAFELIDTRFTPFPPELRAELLALQTAQNNEIHLAALAGNALSKCYAELVEQLLSASRTRHTAIRAIGCHGQTIRHRPKLGYSIQLVNPALLAELSNITVVADFRSRDIAAGGQGAPLVPAFHEAMFRSALEHRVVVNIGGMTNLTDLPPGQATKGFDCGPGNVLLDGWIQKHLHVAFDRNGTWAASGNTIPELSGKLLAHPFFELPPPKSCGREQFDLAWLDTMLAGHEQPADVQATLSDLTARSSINAVLHHCQGVNEIYLCGGGAHNSDLRSRMAALLPGGVSVKTTDELGLKVDWVEGAAFAWLAKECIAGRPANLPLVTGAVAPRILGAIYPAC